MNAELESIYLGACNFTLLHQILDQLREIADPCAHQAPPAQPPSRLPAGPSAGAASARKPSTPVDIVS
jgi:hypothetical protein